MIRILTTGLGCLACLFLSVTGRGATYAVQAGDILVVNHGDNSVYRINPVTGAQRNLGTFRTPTDLALSADGYLYVAEDGGTIQRLNLTNGTRSAVNPLTSLRNVNGVALGPAADLFVTCAASNSVVRINPATGAETNVSQGGLLSTPFGIDLLDADHLVVSCYLPNLLVRVSLADGTQSAIAQGINGIDRPWGVAARGTNIYVAAKDRKELLRAWDGSVTVLQALPTPIFGIGLETDGNIVVGEVNEVSRVSPTGVLLRSFPGPFSEITGVDVSPITVEATGVTNTPPLLTPITTRSVREGTLLTFQAMASDTNWPPQIWTFSLTNDPPSGAAITTNGIFTWRPSAAQGPGIYPITVVVTDDGDPPLSASNTFVVSVSETNTPPTIATITNRTVIAGDLLTFQVGASDSDFPPQSLFYELLPGAPDGAFISPTNGTFSWAPTPTQAPSTNVIRVKVTDDGIPSLSATNNFTVTVLEVNVAPVLDTITDRTVDEGTLLSFWITATDTNRPRQPLEFSLEPGFPEGVSLSPTGLFTWTPSEVQGPSNYVITLKVTDHGLPPLWDTNSFFVQVNEVNTAPALHVPAATNVLQGTVLTFTVAATDADLPAQALTYSLGPDAPTGASISPEGVFSWMPTGSQAPSSNDIPIIVTDHGNPPLAATQTVAVAIRASYVVDVGDLLLADYGGNAVLRMNPRSGATETLCTFPAGPTDLALAPDGTLYVSAADGLIWRLDLTNGTASAVNPATTRLSMEGLAIGPAGDLFATCAGDDVLVRIDPVSGMEEEVVSFAPFSRPQGVDVLDSSHLVVSFLGSRQLIAVNVDDKTQSVIAETAEVDYHWGVAVCATGIYTTGWDFQTLQRVSDGTVSDILLAPGSTYGVAVESDSCVVVGVSSDFTTDVVRVTPQGTASNLPAAGLMGPIAGLDVARIHVGRSLFLESSWSLSSGFTADPDASLDSVRRSITTPRKSAQCFYRLLSTAPVRMTSIRIHGDQVHIDYEFQ